MLCLHHTAACPKSTSGISRDSGSGFRIIEGLLAVDECEALALAITEKNGTRGRAGARHLMSVPAVAALANDSRLLALAAVELGGPAVPYRATLFENVRSGKLACGLASGHCSAGCLSREVR
jgi:hypothetical protein